MDTLRQLFTESIVLAGLGGLLGLALAAFGLSAFESLRPDFPNAESLALDGRVVVFTSVLPARRAGRLDPMLAFRAE